jgi:LPPG:FO 2-phospho-L-lactate transferase
MPTPQTTTESIRNVQLLTENYQVVLLAGGVGGARLADGLARILPPGKLTVIVNTGDDFTHLGLTICPDLDTVVYTLAEIANPATGWGRLDESWRTMTELERLGGPAWFRLGDLDLATHLMRTDGLANGRNLTEVTQELCRRLGVAVTVLPMSNQPAPTLIETEHGLLPFQNWFVGQRWQPAVKQVHLPEDVRATPQVLRAIEQADIVILAPSNPFVSLDPILNVYPLRALIADLPELVLAVSPIIAGQAVKGPAAKMMAELGMEVSATAVAAYYADLIDAFIYDQQDSGGLGGVDVESYQLDILMRDQPDRARLAREIMIFAKELLNQ